MRLLSLHSGTVTLIFFVLVYAAMPMLFAWQGFSYMLGTVLLGIGIFPHLQQFWNKGHEMEFSWQLQWLTKRRFSWKFTFHTNRATVLRLFNWLVVILVLCIVPLVGYILQRQGALFADRFQDQEPVIRATAEKMLVWAQDIAPAFMPAGDIHTVFSGVLGQIFGDIKDLTLAVARFSIKMTSLLLKDWVLVGISGLLICVLVGNWEKESYKFRSIVENGITDAKLRQRTIRFLELYQEGLSILMVGFIEVSLTLTGLYLVLLILFPFNLSLGAILLIALTLGTITAVWKIGGIVAMVAGVFFIVLNFEAGFSWFGYGYFSFGFVTDLIIKASAIALISKVLGVLEAYNFTPVIIGEKLHLTKMQMVATILIWALGAGFFGMIWGVLLMLVFQASMRLTEEIAAEAEVKI
jgi:hypothetical protein